jgi:ubiquinone/menaquinone biosynthesis C-methylase UbiE
MTMLPNAQPSHDAIRDQQRNSWNTFSPGWRKWDTFTMEGLAAQGRAIVDALDLETDSRVLDIASGTGEPSLSIAEIVSEGHVTATDLADKMLGIARVKAQSRGLTNYTTLVADATALPFPDDSFDAISCRLGFMFFPDIELAAREIRRVLKPGGSFATTVWGAPEQNPWVTAIMGAIKQTMDIPQPPPGGPGMFRCARPGALAEPFERVGLRVMEEREIADVFHCSSTDEYWEFMNDVVPPVVAAFQSADPETVARIKARVYATIDEIVPGTTKLIPTGARLVTAVKW